MVSVVREHGGPNASGAPAHDFSTNANACGPCPEALAALSSIDATRYPDPQYTRLRTALARLHAVDVARIVPAASASEFIFRISGWCAAQGARAVSLPPHGYGDYVAAAQAWALVPSRETAVPLAWACEPSSPLGQADARLPALLADAATVVLDRAYEPLRLEGEALAADGLDRCWQLFSPNKALGLTGVRAAYVIAPASGAAAAAQLEAMAPSWVLGAHGVALLAAWCEPAVQRWLDACKPTLREWKARQAALCASFGWQVQPSHANFFSCHAPQAGAQLPALRARGIGLRDCTSFGLPGHLRLGVLPPASQDALRTAWEALA